jgi:hypothetical protein
MPTGGLNANLTVLSVLERTSATGNLYRWVGQLFGDENMERTPLSTARIRRGGGGAAAFQGHLDIRDRFTMRKEPPMFFAAGCRQRIGRNIDSGLFAD